MAVVVSLTDIADVSQEVCGMTWTFLGTQSAEIRISKFDFIGLYHLRFMECDISRRIKVIRISNSQVLETVDADETIITIHKDYFKIHNRCFENSLYMIIGQFTSVDW